jgi:LPPG:FO 2-phospho-L-lactate transferase
MGIEYSEPAPGVLDSIDKADAVVICPSNPWVSIDPILSVPKIQTALERRLVIAVSPIIGNQTIKGPAAKMFSELGIEPSAFAVAQHYGSIIDGLLTDIVMHDRMDRGRLGTEVVEVIKSWEMLN